MEILGEVLGQATVIPVPAAAVEAVMGQQAARETALISQRVLPARLEAAGFSFYYPELFEALTVKLGTRDRQQAGSWEAASHPR